VADWARAQEDPVLIVAGEIEIDPARREDAIAAAREMMDATRREPGCTAYVFSADLADPGRFRIFEEWESQAALDAHFAAPHMAAFQGRIGALGVRGMRIQKYEVARAGPLR
jgi:quinol monooxygenase YgiN